MEFLIVAIVLLGVLWLFLGKKSTPFKKPEVSVISKEELRHFEAASSLWVNRSETQLFQTLLAGLPTGFHVHGKVRVEDIIRVKSGVDPKRRWSLRGRVKSRHVDYLLTDRAGRPLLAIELDGASHRKGAIADDVKTALFLAAGVPLKRIRVGQDFRHFTATIATELSQS